MSRIGDAVRAAVDALDSGESVQPDENMRQDLIRLRDITVQFVGTPCSRAAIAAAREYYQLLEDEAGPDICQAAQDRLDEISAAWHGNPAMVASLEIKRLTRTRWRARPGRLGMHFRHKPDGTRWLVAITKGPDGMLVNGIAEIATGDLFFPIKEPPEPYLEIQSNE